MKIILFLIFFFDEYSMILPNRMAKFIGFTENEIEELYKIHKIVLKKKKKSETKTKI